MFLIDILDRVRTQGLKEETPGRPPCARFTCSLTVMSLKDAIRLLEFTNQLGYILYHEHYLNVQNELLFVVLAINSIGCTHLTCSFMLRLGNVTLFVSK